MRSCGFAQDQGLVQSNADVSNTNAEYRLSWHLGINQGGYRAGALTGIFDDTWMKVVYFADASCEALSDDYEVPNYGLKLGVHFGLPISLFQSAGGLVTWVPSRAGHRLMWP